VGIKRRVGSEEQNVNCCIVPGRQTFDRNVMTFERNVMKFINSKVWLLSPGFTVLNRTRHNCSTIWGEDDC